MRNIKLALLAAMLGLWSYGAMAAGMSNTDSSATAQTATLGGSAHFSTASAGLDEKAVPDGDRTYPATSVSGQHNLHSTAVVYD